MQRQPCPTCLGAACSLFLPATLANPPACTEALVAARVRNDLDPMAYDEIASWLGLSSKTVREAEDGALVKLKRRVPWLEPAASGREAYGYGQ